MKLEHKLNKKLKVPWRDILVKNDVINGKEIILLIFFPFQDLRARLGHHRHPHPEQFRLVHVPSGAALIHEAGAGVQHKGGKKTHFGTKKIFAEFPEILWFQLLKHVGSLCLILTLGETTEI